MNWKYRKRKVRKKLVFRVWKRIQKSSSFASFFFIMIELQWTSDMKFHKTWRRNKNMRRRKSFLRRQNLSSWRRIRITSWSIFTSNRNFIRELHCKFLIHRKYEVLTKMINFLYQMLLYTPSPLKRGILLMYISLHTNSL